MKCEMDKIHFFLLTNHKSLRAHDWLSGRKYQLWRTNRPTLYLAIELIGIGSRNNEMFTQAFVPYAYAVRWQYEVV